jgi:hypothetical protein
MTLHLKTGGTWREVTQPYVKVSNVWNACSAVYIKQGGVWRLVWEPAASDITLSGSAANPNEAVESQAGAATAGWNFNTDGTVDKVEGGTVTQFQDGIEWDVNQDVPVDDYWLRATVNTGDAPTTGNTGVWNKISGASSANYVLRWTKTVSGSHSVKIEIASDSGGSTIVATGYYGCDLTVT